MYNADLYQRSNSLQKRDARQCLEDYAKKIEWNNCDDTVIDIGCGDGGVTTSILKTFIPNNCKQLVGCDISENMVQFANAHHANDFVSFKVLDIESDLPGKFRGKFDHAFSFYALHWINHQKNAFSNIYDLLASGGDCLLMFLGNMPVYDIFREMARLSRWSYWLKEVERFMPPYHDCQDPEKYIKIMMTNIGFTCVEIICLPKVFVYTGVENFKNAMSSINPFKIPLEFEEDFLDDYVKLASDMGFVDHTNNDAKDTFNVKMHYRLLVVNGKKEANQKSSTFIL